MNVWGGECLGGERLTIDGDDRKKNTVSGDNDDHDDGSAGSVLADLASGSPVIYRVFFYCISVFLKPK